MYVLLLIGFVIGNTAPGLVFARRRGLTRIVGAFLPCAVALGVPRRSGRPTRECMPRLRRWRAC